MIATIGKIVITVAINNKPYPSFCLLFLEAGEFGFL
jgi:hypothetical protein